MLGHKHMRTKQVVFIHLFFHWITEYSFPPPCYNSIRTCFSLSHKQWMEWKLCNVHSTINMFVRCNIIDSFPTRVLSVRLISRAFKFCVLLLKMKFIGKSWLEGCSSHCTLAHRFHLSSNWLWSPNPFLEFSSHTLINRKTGAFPTGPNSAVCRFCYFCGARQLI
jgi:hypothetical protein